VVGCKVPHFGGDSLDDGRAIFCGFEGPRRRMQAQGVQLTRIESVT
jgi:hypothetical protein